MNRANLQSLEELLSGALERLRTTFGFSSFREGQVEAIRAVFSGRDALVVMPTGSGKSLCYQVPALTLPGVTVVVSPLIALMKDQVDSLTLRGVPVTFINSSIGADEQGSRLRALQSGAFKLVYVAPERFRSQAFRSVLSKLDVALLAVDEAHCISQWGHDFRPDYRKLKDVRARLGPVPVIALTATATPEVQEDIARELDMGEAERVVTGFDRPNLSLEVRKTSKNAAKMEALCDFILEVLRAAGADAREGGGVPAGIIYTGTRKRAEEVTMALNLAFPRAATSRAAPLCLTYHAGLDPERRREAQQDFMEGRIPWIAATNAFGMGVDKSDIRFVVHHSLPGSIESYYQEVGRAGRDGLPSRCLLLFSEGDRQLQEFFIEGANPSRQTIEAVHEFLRGLGANPIFETLAALESAFQVSGHATTSNPLVFRSSVAALERADVVERLDHNENFAEVSPIANPWPPNPYPERATVKHSIHEALGRVFAETEGEPAKIRLERWASNLGMPEESLRRGLSQLVEDGAVRYVPPFRGRAIRLPDHPVSLDTSGLDFEALARRRRRDEERLEGMLRLARSRECRRNAVLHYFGEKVPGAGCGSCDICAGGKPGAGAEPRIEKRDLTDGELTVVRMVLSGVARARGRCGRRRISQMLRGSKSRGIAELGLDKLSTYGLLRHHNRDALDGILEALEREGCLRQSADRFPVVHLTRRGLLVMKGEERISLALPPASGRRASSPLRAVTGSGSAAGVDGEALDFDEELFEELRKLRRKIADELSVPAFRVFNDRTLKTMARDLPTTEEALLRVPGVGAVTLKSFGARFLAVVREHAAAPRER